MNRTLFFFILVLACAQCNTIEKQASSSPENSKLKYAKGFKVSSLGKATLVEVLYPYQGATTGYTYLLVERGQKVPPHDPNTAVIFTPIASIICTATSHLPLLDYLGASNKLVGFPTLDYVSSEKIRNRIDSGKVMDVGIDKSMNMELIASLKPDLVMGYTMTGDFGHFKKIQELGVPVVMNAEYLEEHPLGRAEWIKFMALFINKEKEAEIVFDMIEQNYLQTKELLSENMTRPTVLSGVVYGDAWFLPGGQNYNSKILKDAGYQYLWENDTSKGYLQLDFESVYEHARDADYWLGVASFNSLQEIKNADERYTKFKPYREKQVYTYDARKGAKGGSEFLELGYLRPDIILKDLVKIAHPELLPEYQLYFYKKLE
jgi:iron complex transport system substrate-binding protein